MDSNQIVSNKETVEFNGTKIEYFGWKNIPQFSYKAHNDKFEWGGMNRKSWYKSDTVADNDTFVMIDGIPVPIGNTDYIFQPELSVGHPDCEASPILWDGPDGNKYLAFRWFKQIKDAKGKITGIVYEGKLEIPGRISKKLLEANGMLADDEQAMGKVLAANGCQLILTGNSVYQKKKDSDEQPAETPQAKMRNLILSKRPELSVS